MAVCLMFLNTLNKDPNGEAMRALISPQATGWEKVDWDELKRDCRLPMLAFQLLMLRSFYLSPMNRFRARKPKAEE